MAHGNHKPKKQYDKRREQKIAEERFFDGTYPRGMDEDGEYENIVVSRPFNVGEDKIHVSFN